MAPAGRDTDGRVQVGQGEDFADDAVEGVVVLVCLEEAQGFAQVAGMVVVNAVDLQVFADEIGTDLPKSWQNL